MRTIRYMLIVFLICGPNVQAAADSPELLVKLRRDPPVEDPTAVHAYVGARLVRSFQSVGWDLVRLPQGMSASEGLAKYQELEEVADVAVNGIVSLQSAPPREQSEPRLGAMRATSATAPSDPQWANQWNLKKIGMPAAWAVTTGNSNVVVAVLDSGVDYTHEDLRENMWRNPGESGLDSTGKDRASNGIDDEGNGYIDDVYGIDIVAGDADPMDDGLHRSDGVVYHGTACAGIIAAVGDNSCGVAGMARSVRVMAIRILHELEAGAPYTLSSTVATLVEAFDYLISQRRRGVNIRIANHSWGYGPNHLPPVRDALELAGEEGILSVFAAGNSGLSRDTQWLAPASYDSPYTLAVANSDQSDAIFSRSNYGKSTVDIAAPGRDIPTLSTNAEVTLSYGTSASAPHVAGAAALMLAVKPDATTLELKGALLHSVDQPASMRGRVVSNGRLNVMRALQVLTNTTLPPIVIDAAPSSSHTDVAAPIEIRFSASMDRASVENALQLTPPVSGIFEWAHDSRLLRLRPSAPLLRTNYSGRIRATAQDLAGRTLDGDFDRQSELAPTDDFVWTFRFAPANDDFEHALLLQGASGSIQGNTSNSSSWADDPFMQDLRHLGGPSLWYEWTADRDGWVTFDTSNPDRSDTTLFAYSLSAIKGLQEIIYSEDHGTRVGSRVSFAVSAGARYFIAVLANGSGLLEEVLGPFTLTWYPTPGPTFTGVQTSSVRPGQTVTLLGANFTGATEVLFDDARASFTPGLMNNADLRITAIVPPDATDGPVTIRTPHGDVTSAFNFTVLPPPLTVAVQDGGVEVSWPATSPLFTLESTENIDSPKWTIANWSFVQTNGHTIVRSADLRGNRFFRLKK